MATKKCTACGEEKHTGEFREGQGRCRPCLAEADRKRRKARNGGQAVDAAGDRVPDKVKLEVMLKAVTVRERKVSIGWEAKREDCTLDTADNVFVNTRLDVELSVSEDQKDLFEDLGGSLPKLKAVADSARLSIGIGTFTGTLTFVRQDVAPQVDDLLLFAGKQGYLTAKRTGARGAPEANAKEDEGGEVVAAATGDAAGEEA